MPSNKCIFITLSGIGKNLALATKMQDKYAPRTTGVYDVVVEEFEGPKS